MLLINFNDNYADEFDVNGFRIATEEEWEQEKESMKAAFAASQEIQDFFYDPDIPSYRRNYRRTIEMYFGTNEALEWDSYDDAISCFSAVKITEEEAESLNRLLNPGNYGYGIIPDHYFWEECWNEEFKERDLKEFEDFVDENDTIAYMITYGKYNTFVEASGEDYQTLKEKFRYTPHVHIKEIK